MAGFMRQYSWVVDLVGILLCSFFLSKVVGVYLGKSIEVKKSIGVLKTAEEIAPERKKVDLSEYKIIIERNIFDSASLGGESVAGEGTEAAAEEQSSTGEAVKTGLSIKVMGVLVVGDGRDKRSTASIAGGGGGGKGASTAIYAVGDVESFAPNTKLTRVRPDRIEFLNSGRLEYAEVLSETGDSIFGPPKRETVTMKEEPKTQAATTVKKETSGKFVVDQREIDDAIQNLDKLYTEIRAVPNFAGGKVSGMKILSVKEGSLFSKLGMKRGDILQKINGLELDVKRGFEIFNQLKEQKNITLDMIRQGQPMTLDYEIR